MLEQGFAVLNTGTCMCRCMHVQALSDAQRVALPASSQMPCNGWPAADSDIVFTFKPVWASYMKLIERSQADAAFQREEPGAAGVGWR